ncbi:hypothetical protein NQZ68_009192 [Dissostichus eleginoides]|nr:hypothetical protein NQZ68_009192 [Dissostichus eleginoides]
MCVSCTLNTILGVPLLLVIPRSPSLLRQARFLLLTHSLVLCDNLQGWVKSNIKVIPTDEDASGLSD